MEKGQSPFYPGQPVPVELFVGREREISHILTRGVGQVERGKPVAVYVQGDYGIGKSSIARYLQFLAAEKHGLVPVNVSLSLSKTIEDLATSIVEGVLYSGAIHSSRGERLRQWLARYIGKQDLFGFTINLEALRKDAPQLASVHGILAFLRETVEKAKEKEPGTTGVFLVLDEINGLAGQQWFAQLLKGLVDTNALAEKPLPLLLMLCGTQERRRQLIEGHQPVERIFDIVEIERMSESEMREFFQRAFDSVGLVVSDDGMKVMTLYAAGFPKLMHLIGDWAYWTASDPVIDNKVALQAVINAADDFGKKYVDQQVVAALRSQDYRSILSKIADAGLGDGFSRGDIEKTLDESERGKLGNFLQKMKQLGVLRSGDARGECIFNVRLVRLYLFLKNAEMRVASN